MHGPSIPSPIPFSPPKTLLWDIFCRVIDNFGDVGVCWRLCADLARRGHQVRLWIDDASALQWMAPGALQGSIQGVQVRDWAQSHDAAQLATLPPADVWIESFGCKLAPEFIAARAYSTGATGLNYLKAPVWINLEYLSAEGFVERTHGLPSPVMSGPAHGWTKHFFYPGFTARTGGLLREPDLRERQHAFEQNDHRAGWLSQHGITWVAGERLVTLFCYEPPALLALLTQLDGEASPTRLLVTPGRAQQAVEAAIAKRASQAATKTEANTGSTAPHNLRISFLPSLTQHDFDHLLWLSDLNLVRGEDSLVRALWAGKPFVWQIYPQDDAAHHEKLDAFLDWLGANASQRQFHHQWNHLKSPSSAHPLPLAELDTWAQIVQSGRSRLVQMDDLATQLVTFVWKKR